MSWSTNPTKCLDVTGSQTTNGNPIQLWDCLGQLSQKLILPNGTGQIRWSAYPNKCLDVTGGSTTNGNRIQLWDCLANEPNQQFTYVAPSSCAAGTWRWAAHPEKCFDVAYGGTANGNRIQIYDCLSNVNQLFAPCGSATPVPTSTTLATTTTTRAPPATTSALAPVSTTTRTTTAVVPATTAAPATTRSATSSVPAALSTCTGTLSWSTNPNQCLDVSGGQSNNGNPIQLWDCQAGNANQQLVLPRNGTGPIRWSANPSKCLDVTTGLNVNGNKIQLWDCQASQASQQFTFVATAGGAGTWRWAAFPAKCLDVTDGSATNGNKIQVWDCFSSANQVFTPCAATTATTTPAVTSSRAPATGWAASGQVAGSGWCQGEVPVNTWDVRSTCSSSTPLRVKVLTYNLYWWNLFTQRGGNSGSAGKLIAAASQPVPYDFMGFQECDDVARVLQDAGLASTFTAVAGTHATAVAYRTAAWEALASGQEDVAEDQPSQYYGRRAATWVRLRHRTTSRTVLFVTHHGPLQVGSGGACGGVATAYNILRLVGKRAGAGDAVVLTGDFNSGPGTGTVQTLDGYLYRLYTGNSFGGIDHIYGSCAGPAVSTRNLGGGGSDHDALDAMLQI